VALNWLVSKGNTFPIPKASRLEHMKENIASIDFTLSNGEVEKINATKGRKRPIGGVLRPLLKKNAAWSKAMTKMNRKRNEDNGVGIGEE
ncbi:Aldo/keto reductase, partial [mine drainage metagenome]